VSVKGQVGEASREISFPQVKAYLSLGILGGMGVSSMDRIPEPHILHI